MATKCGRFHTDSCHENPNREDFSEVSMVKDLKKEWDGIQTKKAASRDGWAGTARLKFSRRSKFFYFAD